MARRRNGQRRQGAVLSIRHFERAGSTNADMLALAARGAAQSGDWLFADVQDAGRGRSGRDWASPRGNLHASGLFALKPGDPHAPTLALAAGIAVHDALDIAGTVLKWPNDVLADGAKLAGILLERHQDDVVIGVGVNLIDAPDLHERSTTSLAKLGRHIAPREAVQVVADAFDRWVALWRSDLPAIRRAWLDRAHPIGTPLAAALPDGSRLDGRFDGLTDACALMLRLADDEVRVIHAGDVFLI